MASQLISIWELSHLVIEEDFLPEEEVASTSTVLQPVPHASVLAVVTAEPGTGRIKGSRWQVAWTLEHPIKFKASRLFADVEDKLVTFHITLPKLLNFEFRGEGPHKNFSNWMNWEKVFQLGSVALRNSKGTANATDMEAIVALCPQAASGMLFWIIIAPKSLGNFVLLVNIIPGTVTKLHERCRQQGLVTSHEGEEQLPCILTAL